MPYTLYHYSPSLPAAGIALTLFLLTTLCHGYQLGKNRTWYFIPFLVGGFFEWIGYIGRIINGNQQIGHWTIGPYILQSLLLLLAPALFAASIYMILGRIIRLAGGERYSIIPISWITKIFVAGDVISFLMQSTGGGLLAVAKTESAVTLGNDVIIAGLFVQLLFFGIFILATAKFHLRAAKDREEIFRSGATPWKKYLRILYAVSGLIMIRSIFRAAEYIQGNDGYIISHEGFLYAFDSLLMFSAMVLFNIWHPSMIVRGSSREKLTNTGSLPGNFVRSV